ncbi:hypothetical protein, partial [Stutzerimonas nitrititolerans]|uniref:hypothetical protein n=1 Tax=Stutzerimonas nitrititolerans TaxID=2482751 RepID=UPI0028B06B9A
RTVVWEDGGREAASYPILQIKALAATVERKHSYSVLPFAFNDLGLTELFFVARLLSQHSRSKTGHRHERRQVSHSASQQDSW